MKKTMWMMGLVMGLMSALTQTAAAQTAVQVKDTMLLTVSRIEPEPDPNHNTYTFAIFGTDAKGQKQKVQIEYVSTTMYGTFTNDDFYNWDHSQGSGSFNFIRRDDSSGMGFYSFREELTATVTDNAGATEVSINGLINVLGRWTRVLAEGVIPAVEPSDTITTDLGVVSTIPNSFYQYLVLTAANDDYSLATGIIGSDSLAVGTYYMVDMLRPDLVTAEGDTILPASAELTVTVGEEAGTYSLLMNFLSQDNTLYLIQMHTGRIAITDTVAVACTTGQLSYSEVYNMYQFAGENADYVVALSVAPGVLRGQVTDIPADSIMLTFTTVGIKATEMQIHVFDAAAHLVYDPANPSRITVFADFYGTDGTLYQAVIPIGWSVMPEAQDTVVVDCGEGVIRIDYNRGLGFMGLVLGNVDENTFANVVIYNGLQYAGTYYNEDFDYESEPGMYVQTLVFEDSTYRNRLVDIRYAQMQIDSVGTSLHFALDALVCGDSLCSYYTLYRFTATMSAKDVLTGEEKEYNVSLDDDCRMVALQTVSTTLPEQLYRLQLQRSDSIDDDGNLVGDAEVWDFYFKQENWDGVKGTFGYSEGNLALDVYHTVYADGVEILLGPVAGTLTLTPIQPIIVRIYGRTYHSWIYTIEAEFVAENGILYRLSGQNFLLCVNNDTEQLVELTEEAWTAIEETLGRQGLRAKKILRNGMILLETKNGTYDLSGRMRK